MKKPKPFLSSDDMQSGEDGGEINTVYGDMITFIMMLFILLFVLSYNEKQSETFFTEMRVQFGAKKVEQQNRLTSEALFVSKLQGYIQEEKLEEVAKVLVDEQKIKLIIDPPVLYDTGKAALKPEGQKVLAGFAAIIKDVENPIIVEGHTDSVPIKNEEFESNWELSFHRAYSVIKFFINNLKYSPTQLSALGYGEYRPIASNDTPEGRAKNRRVEINIIRLTQAPAQ